MTKAHRPPQQAVELGARWHEVVVLLDRAARVVWNDMDRDPAAGWGAGDGSSGGAVATACFALGLELARGEASWHLGRATIGVPDGHPLEALGCNPPETVGLPGVAGWGRHNDADVDAVALDRVPVDLLTEAGALLRTLLTSEPHLELTVRGARLFADIGDLIGAARSCGY